MLCYHTIWTCSVYELQQVSFDGPWRKLSRNIITQNTLAPHALCALRAEGVGGWCPCEDALCSGSISTSSAVLINPKPGDGGDIPAVFASRAAPVHRGVEMGDQKVSRGRRNRCLRRGDAVSGRSVQRKEEEKQRNRGVSGCGARSYWSLL